MEEEKKEESEYVTKSQHENQHSILIFLMVIFFVVSIAIVLLIVGSGEAKDFNYCVEWDGTINRENLFVGCYDFEQNGFRCITRVDNETHQLYVRDYNNDTSVYNCTRLLKSKEVK